jgi:sugar/nucleoside kinase (ribokinase family)
VNRVIHTGQALVDVVVEVHDLPARGQNVMATSATDYAGGAVTVLAAAARFGADCVHAGALGTGPHGDLIRAALQAEGIIASADPVPDRDTGICVVMVEPSAERTVVTDACAGSTPENHRAAMDVMALYPPQITLATTDEVIG